MLNPSRTAAESHLPEEIRSVLEERFWRPVDECSTLEALQDTAGLVEAPDRHPLLFADHGIVHVRDIAVGVVDLAALVEGMLLPARPPERQDFVVALGVLITYLHDAGMHDPSPAGRRTHAVYAAHLAFSDEIDDVVEQLMEGGGPVVRRIEAVHHEAPFAVSPEVVLRELASLGVAHSKTAVPAALLADFASLRKLMQNVVLTGLDHHRNAEAPTTPESVLPDVLSENARHYANPTGDSFAWLDSTETAHDALVEDAIDAVRLVRAADALRQRGTTLRTTAGYEIFIDADTGAAMFALRTEDNDRLLLLRVDSPLSAGEANLRGAFVTSYGDLRVVFHRGRFSSPEAAASASSATAQVVADIGADVLGAFAHRHPSSDLPPPSRDPATMRVELERPADDPSFADAVARGLAARDARLAARVAVVADLEGAAPAEQERYYRAATVPADSNERAEILESLAGRGMKIATIDRTNAFEDVRRIRLESGETLVEAGSSPAFVYVATEPGLRVKALGGYEDADVPAWLPIGITGVVRRGERNSTVVAADPVDVLMIPGELFAREWFHPFEQREIADLLAGIGLP